MSYIVVFKGSLRDLRSNPFIKNDTGFGEVEAVAEGSAFRQVDDLENEIQRLRAENEEQSFFIVKGAERELALQAENARLREALKDARNNGLIYWEPRTERGHVSKAQMLSRIDAALAEKENSNV